MAAGWPLTGFTGRGYEPIFGPDGTVYVLAGTPDAQGDYRQSLVALDAAGFVKPGWPIEESPGSHFGSLDVGPDGSVYVDACGGPEVGCVLHRFSADGREFPSWPFEVPPNLACLEGSSCFNRTIVGSRTAHFGQWGTGGLSINAIDASGKIVPGWPIALDAQGGSWSNAQVGSDGTLFILGMPDDGSDSLASLAAFAPDGRPRSGWPVSLPSESDFVLGPQGTVIVWSWIDFEGELCAQPRRTLFTVLSPAGRALFGWPRGSTGYASNPVVGADGTVYYVSALGNVYAHDPAGEVKPGWPVTVPGANVWWCLPTSPYLAPDGTIYVLTGDVTALSSDGRRRPGWPYRPAGDLNLPCWPVGDTDGVPSPHAPAFGPDGTVYLVVCRAETTGPRLEIIALDPQGQLKPGWPYQLPIDPATVQLEALTVSPDGRLFVRGGHDAKSLLLALDPDGSLSE